MDTHKLIVVYWHDLMGDLDDTDIDWTHDVDSDLAYGLVTIPNVRGDIEAHIKSLESDLVDNEDEDDVENLQAEIAYGQNVIDSLNSLEPTVLVAFDG